jgi:hypothetical protein
MPPLELVDRFPPGHRLPFASSASSAVIGEPLAHPAIGANTECTHAQGRTLSSPWSLEGSRGVGGME